VYRNPGIHIDRKTFDPERVSAVRHALMEHPLLQLPALIELGKRLGAAGSVRYHNASAEVGTSFTHAPETHKAKLSVAESLERIDQAEAWMALHNIQQDQQYRTLVDEVLDFVRPQIEPKDPGMTSRAGWIFVSSPRAVTPFHMDHENNFILQIHGTKTLYVWEPLDREVVPERSLELFHGAYSRELVIYKESLKPRAHVFHLVPGLGGYMPQTAPHAVENGPGVSVTLSVTYLTDATRRRALLHRANHLLRQRGISPTPVGKLRVVDAVKHAAFRTALTGARLVGRGPPAPRPYADTSNLVPV
jgi:hypothetical protein